MNPVEIDSSHNDDSLVVEISREQASHWLKGDAVIVRRSGWVEPLTGDSILALAEDNQDAPPPDDAKPDDQWLRQVGIEP